MIIHVEQNQIDVRKDEPYLEIIDAVIDANFEFKVSVTDKYVSIMLDDPGATVFLKGMELGINQGTYLANQPKI